MIFGVIIKPLPEDQTECKQCQYKTQFQSHQTGVHQRVQICSYIWAHGPVFTMESTQSDAATKLRLRYTGKKALLSAIISGYHDRPTRILRCEDIALVIWGNKVTGDVSTPLRFHASKEVARNYLRTRTRDKWPNKRFEEVDWEHWSWH